MSLTMQPEDFQHILRILNTNIEGVTKMSFALTKIKGVGRRFATVACKKCDIDIRRRAGTMTPEEQTNLVAILQNPTQYKIPVWFLNRKKDPKDGKDSQMLSNVLDQKLRDDLNKLIKIRCNRGIRHAWGLRVRGQHTKTTGRRGKTVGVSKKK